MHIVEVAKFSWRNMERFPRSPAEVTEQYRRASSTVKAMRELKNQCIKDNDWLCWYCESIDDLHIHHVLPVSVAPTKAGDEDNMCVLCKDCHFVIAHVGNWQTYQPKILDILEMRGPIVSTYYEKQ